MTQSSQIELSLTLFLTGGGTALLDLSGLDTSPQSPLSFPEFPTPSESLNAPSQETEISLLDDELMSLGNSTTESTHPSSFFCVCYLLNFNFFHENTLRNMCKAYVFEINP